MEGAPLNESCTLSAVRDLPLAAGSEWPALALRGCSGTCPDCPDQPRKPQANPDQPRRPRAIQTKAGQRRPTQTGPDQPRPTIQAPAQTNTPQPNQPRRPAQATLPAERLASQSQDNHRTTIAQLIVQLIVQPIVQLTPLVRNRNLG